MGSKQAAWIYCSAAEQAENSWDVINVLNVEGNINIYLEFPLQEG